MFKLIQWTKRRRRKKKEKKRKKGFGPYGQGPSHSSGTLTTFSFTPSLHHAIFELFIPFSVSSLLSNRNGHFYPLPLCKKLSSSYLFPSHSVFSLFSNSNWHLYLLPLCNKLFRGLPFISVFSLLSNSNGLFFFFIYSLFVTSFLRAIPFFFLLLSSHSSGTLTDICIYSLFVTIFFRGLPFISVFSLLSNSNGHFYLLHLCNELSSSYSFLFLSSQSSGTLTDTFISFFWISPAIILPEGLAADRSRCDWPGVYTCT